MLLHELPATKQKLQDAFVAGDYRFLRGEIHRLLGGMAYCNFADLHELTLQFQVSLKANSSTISDDFNKLAAEIDRLINSKFS
jgi:HPt (histidine-containing phosphotransfer) domain-containing protein